MPLHAFLSLLAAAATAALCSAGEANATGGGCAFPLGTRWDDPLLIWRGGGWVYPDMQGKVRVEEGAEILVECLGEDNSVMLLEGTGSGSEGGSGNGLDDDKDTEEAVGAEGGQSNGEDGVIAEGTVENSDNGNTGQNGGDAEQGDNGDGGENGKQLIDGVPIGGGDRARRNSDCGDKTVEVSASGRLEVGDGGKGGLGIGGKGDENIAKDREDSEMNDGIYGDNGNREKSRIEESKGGSDSRDKRDTNSVHVKENIGREEEKIEIGGSELKVTCVAGRNFSIGQRVVNITNLKCRKSPKYGYEFPKVTTIESTRTSCGGPRRSELFQLGFTTSAGFLEMIEICFDTNTLTPVYTKHLVPREIKGRRSSKGKSWFRVGPKFRGMNPTKYYSGQRASLKSLNVSVGPGQFLNRGHLSPRGDFIQVPQQRATYIYENTAPQWASFNAGDWEKLEKSIRNLAAARRNLTVITGTYGSATLKNSENKDVPIYLNRGRGRKKMTVPAVFWKVVFDPDASEGIAVLGANKPRDGEVSLPAWPCDENICAEVVWFVRRGQFHCCTVQDMQRHLQLRVLRDLPPLQPLTSLTPPIKVPGSVDYSVRRRA